MAYKIDESCISCGACTPECPNEAIEETEPYFKIIPERCTECVGSFESSRCALVCPVDSCVPDPEHEETREALLAKWQTLHPGETPAVT
jgi:ferredoxin